MPGKCGSVRTHTRPSSVNAVPFYQLHCLRASACVCVSFAHFLLASIFYNFIFFPMRFFLFFFLASHAHDVPLLLIPLPRAETGHTHTHMQRGMSESDAERGRGRESTYTVTYCYIFHYVNARFTPFFFRRCFSCCCCLLVSSTRRSPLPPLPFLPLLPLLYLFIFSHCSSSCMPRLLSSVAWDLRALYKKYCSIYKYTSIHYTHIHSHTH